MIHQGNCPLSNVDLTRLSALSVPEAAVTYAKHRVSIFPVAGDDTKKPLVMWTPYQRQAPSISTVEQWFTKYFQQAHIGLPAGKLNNILGVDVDSQEDTEFFFETFPQAKHSLMIKTPRGYHIYFLHQEGFKNNIGIFGRKIDIRTTGGYLRAPTSPGYEFLNDNPILPAPVELVAAIATDRTVVKRKPVHNGELIVEGVRNDSLFRIACSLQSKGYPDDQILAVVSDVNAQLVVPPLPIQEIEGIFQSVTTRYQKGNRPEPTDFSIKHVDAGYYICQAIRSYPFKSFNRRSQVLEWRELTTGCVFRQFFKRYKHFPPASKAAVNYFLIFREYPKRLDRLDFGRFIDRVALVEIANSQPNLDWTKDLSDLSLPDALIESRVISVVCGIQEKINPKSHLYDMELTGKGRRGS